MQILNSADTIEKIRKNETSVSDTILTEDLKYIVDDANYIKPDKIVSGISPLRLPLLSDIKNMYITGNSDGIGSKTSNLLTYPFDTRMQSVPTTTPKTLNGITYYCDNKGTLYLNGTSTATNTDIYLFGGWMSTTHNLNLRDIYIKCNTGKITCYLGIFISGTQDAYPIVSSYERHNIAETSATNFLFLRITPAGVVFNNETVKISVNNAPIMEYEPYGYKIPIILGGISQNVYTPQKLYSTDTLETNGNELQYIKGTNILSVNSVGQPDNITVIYK